MPFTLFTPRNFIITKFNRKKFFNTNSLLKVLEEPSESNRMPSSVMTFASQPRFDEASKVFHKLGEG